jgi:flagellar export protein FliJ
MKTPYDTVVRLRRNELDGLRRELGLLQTRQDELADQLTALETALDQEADAATDDPFNSFARYAARNKHEQVGIQNSMLQVEHELNAMRDRVREAFQDMKSIETAAENFRDEQMRVLAAREQAELDEASLQMFTRAQ